MALELADRLLPALIQFQEWILEFNQNGEKTKAIVDTLAKGFEFLGNSMLSLNAAIQAPISFWQTLFDTRDVKAAFEEWKNVWQQYQHRKVRDFRALKIREVVSSQIRSL